MKKSFLWGLVALMLFSFFVISCQKEDSPLKEEKNTEIKEETPEKEEEILHLQKIQMKGIMEVVTIIPTEVIREEIVIILTKITTKVVITTQRITTNPIAILLL